MILFAPNDPHEALKKGPFHCKCRFCTQHSDKNTKCDTQAVVFRKRQSNSEALRWHGFGKHG